MITKEKFIEICNSYGLVRFSSDGDDEYIWYQFPEIDEEVCQYECNVCNSGNGLVMCYDDFHMSSGYFADRHICSLGLLKECKTIESLIERLDRISESVRRIKKQMRIEAIENL